MPLGRIFRFGAFEFHVQARELRKHGLRIKLSGQPISVLAMLLERPGEVVTREDLQGGYGRQAPTWISSIASMPPLRGSGRLWRLGRFAALH